MRLRFLPAWACLLALTPAPATAEPLQIDVARTPYGQELTLVKRYATRGPGSLRLEIAGAAQVLGWNEPVVEIREFVRIADDDPTQAERIAKRSGRSYRRSGQHITVNLVNPAQGVARRYEVRVPRSFDVSFRTGGDDVSVLDVAGAVALVGNGGMIHLEKIGGSVGIRTSDGRIDLRDLHGDARVSMSEGRVTVNGVAGDLRLESGEGEITLQGIAGRTQVQSGESTIRAEDLRGAVDIRVQTGDIELVDVAGPVEAGTGEGDLQVRLRADLDHRDRTVTLLAGDGRIQLVLPEYFAADVRAELWQIGGRKGIDPGLIDSAFPLTRRFEHREPGRRTLIATGEVNGGGPRVFLKTYGGPILISRP